MAVGQGERRLAAILAADVAGYSRLMGADEDGTLARLTAHRRELFDPTIAKYRGRIVKTTGDGLLAEFASVIDAVRCAAEVQAGMAERNLGAPESRRLDFRMGINVGDIVEQDNDIFGDGVNIAARLEGIAEPGGVCVSQRVQEDAAGKTGIDFEDIGEQALKNIARPIRVFRVRAAGAIVSAGAPTAAPPPPLPDKPSIAVLPFQNMSGDPEQEYFADGIVEDIITALSRFRSFAVIARNSSFVYKGKAVDVRQVAKDLGVRYVLEGSVRRAGERLRITAQLVDGGSGSHLWAQAFDGAVADVFDLQDRITEGVVPVMEPQIKAAEIERSRRKRPESLDAYDLYLRGIAKFHTMRIDDNAEAYAYLAQAAALEPGHAPFLANAASALRARASMNWPPLTADDRAASLDLVRRALGEAQGDAEVLAVCAYTLMVFGGEYDRGMQIVSSALEANPNSPGVLTFAAVCALFCGSLEDAIAHGRRAVQASPLTNHFAMSVVAHAHMALGDYDEALKAAERSLAMNANYYPTYWLLIAANAQLGRMDEARRWLEKLRLIAPGTNIASIRVGRPDKDPSRMAAIFQGLRLAGLEEG